MVVTLAMLKQHVTISSGDPNMNLVTLAHVLTILLAMVTLAATSMNAQMTSTTVVTTPTVMTTTTKSPVKPTLLVLVWRDTNKIQPPQIRSLARTLMNVLLVLITVLSKEANAQTLTVVGNVPVSPDIMVMELPVLIGTNVSGRITDTFVVPIPIVKISQERSNATVMTDTLIWKVLLSKMSLLFKSVPISSIVLRVKTLVMSKMPFVTKLSV